MRPERNFTTALSDRRLPKATRAVKSIRDICIPDSTGIPLPVYRDFIDMLYSMWLPILGLGVVFVGICVLAAFKLNDPAYAILGALGALTTFWRVSDLRAYFRIAPLRDLECLQHWERRYAIGNCASALLLAALNVTALYVHYPLLHLVTVSLVFSFGAGIVARISVRPVICVISLLCATVPTVVALALHAFTDRSVALHTEMFAIEAALVAMITGLSLQTVAYLYRSAVEHHTVRHDLAQLAKYDALTGLANRLLLRERFQVAMAAAARTETLLAVYFLDLDGFKAINDQYGHPAGDALLEQVAHRLEAIIRSGDTVARLGGDEFVILQGGLRHEDEARLMAGRVIRRLSAPYQINDNAMSVSVSVGIAIAPRQGVTLEQLLGRADAALYRAKSGGKAQAMLCTADDHVKISSAA